MMRALAESPPWRRNQHVTVAMVFVVFTGFAFVIPFLPLYVRALGVRAEGDIALWTGVLIGITPLLAGLLAPLWGRLADRIGHKPLALRALVCYVLLMALSAAVTSVWQLLALRILVGLFGGIGPLGLAMATSLSPREETGRAVGAIQSAQILSAAVGPLMGGLLADTIGIRATFLVTSVACLAALALVAGFYEEPPRSPVSASGGQVQATAERSLASLLTLPRVPALLATLFLVNFVGRSYTPVLALCLQALGAPQARLGFYTGLVISAYAVAAAFSAAFFGRLSRSHTPRRLLLVSLLGGALSVLPMAVAPNVPTFLGLAVALGLTSGGALTLCYTLGALAVPEHSRSAAFGVFASAALFGGAISPSIAGALTHVERGAVFYLDAGLFVLLALLLVPLLPAQAAPGDAARPAA
jgi:DHA1 family multidrug resistance protein-like MFS transporter